jgi:predicted RNA binding protein YcfA (HicA-like mRNA interferase family)
MASKPRDQLLAEFERRGTRSYSEARELLVCWGFKERLTRGGHSFWVHPRGVTLTITTARELATFYQTLVVKKIRQLQLRDD